MAKFNKSNTYQFTKNDYFSVNSYNVPYSGSTVMYVITDSNEKKFIDLKYVLNILKGPNTPTKQLLINKLSDYFYNSNGIYSSMIEKSVGIMTFDRVITQGKSPEAKKFYISLLRKISEKFVGKDALRSCLKYGVYYGYLSYLEKNDNADGTKILTDDENVQIVQFSDASVIPLNPKYMKILATDGKTYRVGIDISQLTDMDIEGFPQEIYMDIKKAKDVYQAKLERNKKKNIKTISKQYYILDDSKTIVIKLRSNASESCGRATFITAIVQLIHDNDLLLRKNEALGKAGKTLIYETYPEGQKGKGTSALTKSQMDAQHDEIVKALRGLNNSEIGFCSLYPNTKLDSIDISSTLSNFNSDDIIKRISTHSGFSTGLLNGMDVKNDKVIPLIYEILAAEFDDFSIQWEKELNKVCAASLKRTYKNILDLPYIAYLPTNRLNRSSYVEMYHRTFTDAGGSYQLYLASTGIPAEIQLDLMDEEISLDFRDKYPAHPMASTSSFVQKDKKEEETNGNEEGQEIQKDNADKDNQSKQSDKSKSKNNKKKGGGK